MTELPFTFEIDDDTLQFALAAIFGVVMFVLMIVKGSQSKMVDRYPDKNKSK